MSATKRLSFVGAHSFIELAESTSGLYLGAGPLPVFALVAVRLPHAEQIHAMLGQFIEAERTRLRAAGACHHNGNHQADGTPGITHGATCDENGRCPLDGRPR